MCGSSYCVKSNLVLPRLPCSSLCFCPLNFSHCWPSPGLGLQKSGGGAYWQGCRWPNPDWTPYGFTRPEKPTCRTVHILALPNLDLQKKEENSVGDTVQQWLSTLKGNFFLKICKRENPRSITFSKGRFTASHNCPALSLMHPPPLRASWETIQFLPYLITVMETKETQVSRALINNCSF